MANDILALLSGEVLEEDVELTLAELCCACQVPAERVFELVQEGIVEPLGRNPAQWRFRGHQCLSGTQCAAPGAGSGGQCGGSGAGAGSARRDRKFAQTFAAPGTMS